MSPLKIAIGLHYYAILTEYAENDLKHQSSPAVQDALAVFVNAGLLEKIPRTELGATYKRTEALEVWCLALQQVPWPIMQWVIPTEESNS